MVPVIEVFPEKVPCNCLARGSFCPSPESTRKCHVLHSWGLDESPFIAERCDQTQTDSDEVTNWYH